MNPGAIIGAVILGGAGAFVVFGTTLADDTRRPGKLIGLGVIIGGAVGSWLWNMLAGKPAAAEQSGNDGE